MRASGDLKPKATLVMRRILMLTDSMRPLESPCSIAARIEGLEVLELVAQGLNKSGDRNRLFMRENTVKNHVRNILERLQVSRMDAVMDAVREKLFDVPDG